jgi:hypothetical protein
VAITASASFLPPSSFAKRYSPKVLSAFHAALVSSFYLTLRLCLVVDGVKKLFLFVTKLLYRSVVCLLYLCLVVDVVQKLFLFVTKLLYRPII